MIEVSIANAKARLSELINRAVDGELVVFTKHGRAVARIAPLGARRTADQKRAALAAITRQAAGKRISGPGAAEADLFLYGDSGLPE